RLAVDVDRAGATLREPTSEARAMQREVVTQRVKQRHVRIVDGDPDRFAVDVQRFSLGHPVLPLLATMFYSMLPHSDAPARQETSRRSEGTATASAEQRDEFPAPHSITSSARASSVGGTSMPTALAVLRLMANSNLVGCMTDRDP